LKETAKLDDPTTCFLRRPQAAESFKDAKVRFSRKTQPTHFCKAGGGMKRSVLYSALAVGIFGTLVLCFTHRPLLSMGWWSGMVVGVINFSSLLSNVERTRKEAQQGSKKVTTALRRRFFVRYLTLAFAFFLILQLGRQQLGSALAGFVSFHVVVFLGYLFQLRKQK